MLPSQVASNRLDSAAGERVLDAIAADPPVVLLGSALSAFVPTCLPAGRAFADTLFEVLFPPTGFDSRAQSILCRSLFQRVPFEHVMECCPTPEHAEDVVVQGLSARAPNVLHEGVANAIINGRIRAIVSPNYDVCLEAVRGFQSVRRVVTEDEARSVLDGPVYFKIHGSIEPQYRSSLVFALRHETVLPTWKRTLLRRLLANRTLLVIGYSGTDFEICPELQRAGCRRIVWNFPTAEELHRRNNVRQLLTVTEGEVLVGDLRALLARVCGVPSLSADWAPSTSSLRAALFAACSREELLEWRARLAVGMGCASVAHRAAAEREGIDPKWRESLEGARVLGNAAFHGGRYRTALRTYRVPARTLALPAGARCGMWLEVAEAQRVYGARLRALMRLRKALRMARRLPPGSERHRLEGAAALRQALIGRGWYQLLGHGPFKRVRSPLRTWLRGRLRLAAEAALAAGDRLNLHQIQLTAERLDIPFDAVVPDDWIGVPTKDGYRNLGYLIAESMVFRDRLKRERTSLKRDDLISLRKYVRQHSLLQNWPEVWKLALLAVRWGPPAYRTLEIRRLVRAFLRCEHSPLFRLSPILWGS